MTDGRRSWPSSGVHRVLGASAAVAAELAARGWRVGLVPPSTTDDGLWDGFADALALPAWFGRNLDALDEALGGLEVPTALVLAGWSTYARARPDRWARLLPLLQDRAADPDASLVVLLADLSGADRGTSDRD